MEMDKAIHDEPLVSVVMCAYNGLSYIREAVACVINQTYSNWELIICDDGSTDGTREWLRTEFGNNPKIRLFFHEKNKGYVANKNFAHQQAKGIYITQLDNDDSCALERLEKQLDVIRINPEIKIVASGYHKIDEEGKIYESISSGKDILIDKDFTGKYPFWFPGLLVHQSVFQTVGYFNEYFSGALGDDLYWTKSANQRYPIYCLPETLYNYRNNPNSITNVFGNIRKLIIPRMLEILFQQQRETGEDWLMKKDFAALQQKEEELKSKKSFMAEQYRIWAAKATDKNDKKLAGSLLWTAFKNNPFNRKIYVTLLYLLRR